MQQRHTLTTATSSLPDWYPEWARRMADLYFAGSTCMFVLHGNVHDWIACPADEEQPYLGLADFLATQVFGAWDLVLQYNLGRGLRPMAGRDPQRLTQMAQYLTGRLGEKSTWPRDPDNVLLLLDAFVERMLLEEDPKQRKDVGILLDYAQYLVPSGDLGSLSRGQGTNLIRLLNWAQNPYIKRANVAFCLVADKLSEINSRLVESPYVATIELPLPDQDAREAFAAHHAVSSADSDGGKTLTPQQVAALANGLSLVNLNTILSQAKQRGGAVEQDRFKQLKKNLIERQCQGLVEFVEPKHTLDLVVGQEAAKARLREDADLIMGNHLDAAPMGYLFCGPVGTGKTFLAECYAGSVGIPCVKLRNFRSKYVGETEGNLENVLTVLRSLGPVCVIIDEADAALGDRSSDGDSGTSSRVFSMIASQMGDTRYRGRIIWMLLTCRPDLLPIDLKRQGRAEVHIPMFYPGDESEIREMFVVMGRKNKVKIDAEAVPKIKEDRYLSGADIESVVLAARRAAWREKRDTLTREDLQKAFEEFIPSAQGLEKELQELAAVLECTQVQFLPDDWRKKVAKTNGRAQLQERMVAIRSLLSE